MNRKQFMKELEQLLRDIPAVEREEALQFYNDYFDDAGEENEAKIIEELGSPEQVANTIREGMSGGTNDSGTPNAPAAPSAASPQKSTNVWKILCIILLCILLCPIIIPLGAAALVVLIAAIVGIIALIIGIAAAGIALLVAGIAAIVLGVIRLFGVPAVGIALGGIGCLILAVGILACLLITWCFTKLIPALIRGIVSLIRFPLRKAGVLR